MQYIGIDNGVTGSISIVDSNGGALFFTTPVREVLNYQKVKASYFKRIDVNKLEKILSICDNASSRVFLERPMVNPGRFAATASALRAFEATLIVLEKLKLSYEIIDSKTWQKVMLPRGLKGAASLKKASKQVALRLFKNVDISKRDDGDSLLIAEYARRSNCVKI
jgi:hypothetical protein